MIGRILFLSLLAATLGGMIPPDKPFNPEYRSQNEDNTLYPYSTITENPGLSNYENLKPNRDEADLNKKPDQNSMVSKTHNIELESDGKESEQNNKILKRNSNESLKNKKLKPNSKKLFERSALKYGNQKSNDLSLSSKENDTLIATNHQNSVSQESEELPSLEKPTSKRNEQTEETHFSNKKSEPTNKNLIIPSNLNINFSEELEKPTSSYDQPVTLGDDGYYKMPKDFFVKWLQANIVKNRMNAGKKRFRHKYAFSPDYRNNKIFHYDSIESQSTYHDEDDSKNNADFNKTHKETEVQNSKTKLYNEILEKNFASHHYLQDALSHDNHKTQVYKELLAKIFKLLQYLIVDKSHNVYSLDDYKAKINKVTLTQILGLLYQLLEEQDQNPSVSQNEKRKIDNNSLADILGYVSTEGQNKNVRQLESKNIIKELLADISAFLQNLPEEDEDSLREGLKVNRSQRFTFIKNSDDQDEKVPFVGEKSKSNKKLLTQIFAILNIPKERDQGESGKIKNRKELLTNLFTIYNTQNEQNQNEPLERDISIDNNGLMAQQLTTIDAQNEQAEKAPSLDRAISNKYNGLITHLRAIINAQNVQDEKAVPVDRTISQDKIKLMNQLLAITNAHNDQEQKITPLGESTSINNKELIRKLNAIFNEQNYRCQKTTPLDESISNENTGLITKLNAIITAKKEQDTSPVLRDNTKMNNANLTKLFAIFRAQNDQCKEATRIVRDSTKESEELLTQNEQSQNNTLPVEEKSTNNEFNNEVSTMLNAPIDKIQTTPPPEQKQKENNEVLTQIVMLQNVSEEIGQKATPPEGHKTNVDYELLGKLLGKLLNISQGQVQVPPQTPGHTSPPNSGYINQGWNTGQDQSHLSQEQLDYLRFLLGQQNRNAPQAQMSIGDKEIQMKLMQLIKDTKEAIDLKVGPVRKVHKAYNTHRLYKTGYLISSINRTYESAIEFYKYIQQNINAWNILKALQAYEQVTAADQFLTKSLHILSILSGDVRIAQPSQRTLQRSHFSALEHTRKLAREGNHTNKLEFILDLALDPKKDLEDINQAAQDHNIVSEDLHKNIYEIGSQRNQNGLLDDTYKRPLGRSQQKDLNRKYYRALQSNRMMSLEETHDSATEQAMNFKGKFEGYQRSKKLNNDQKPFSKRIFKYKYERLLRSNMMALKDITRTLLNQEMALERNSGSLQHNQKGTLARNYERDAIERTYTDQNRVDKLLQHYRKRTVERSKAPELQHNLKRALLRNNKRILIRNKNALKDGYELASGNEKEAVERYSRPKPQNNLKTALLREFEQLLHRNQKWAVDDFARASDNQKRPFGSENTLELQRHQKNALTNAYELALSNEKEPLDRPEVQRNQRDFTRDADKPNSDNRRREEDNPKLVSRSQKAAKRTFVSGVRPKPLKLQPNQKTGYHNHRNTGQYKPMTNARYPAYPQAVDYYKTKMFRQPLCDIDNSLAPCNVDNDKLKWDPLQHQQSVGWAYYDYYY